MPPKSKSSAGGRPKKTAVRRAPGPEETNDATALSLTNGSRTSDASGSLAQGHANACSPRRSSISCVKARASHSRDGSNASATSNSGGRPKRVAYALLRWDDLPDWRRDNAYILTGYRPTSHSYMASLGSVLGIHNESVNIWTHLAGAVVAAVLGLALFVDELPVMSDVVRFVLPAWLVARVGSVARTVTALAVSLVVRHFPAATARLADTCVQLAGVVTLAPRHLLQAVGATRFARVHAAGTSTDDTASSTLVLSCFAAGAVACLGMSAVYHALSNHSPAVARWGNKLDYSGIVFLIVGSYVPTLYYGFFCHPRWLTTYLYLIVLLGLACLAVSWLEHFRTPAWRPYRALLFVALGVSGAVPIAHSLLLLEDGDTLRARYLQLDERMGLNWVLLQGLLYVTGASLYATRWPERWSPGRFDIWGSSHQIFHVFVLLAAASHLRGVMEAYLYHHNVMGASCPVPPL
ncbi:hypothetical protein SEPCBS119000_004043 [Sporothrix epigloea]|uniref:Uncharacterized protein n=1 Tax=Sporothrix epigloea TaxID=1892477 RepID=A0ABP0DQ21_9PEZI